MEVSCYLSSSINTFVMSKEDQMSIQLNANIATSSFGQGAAPSSPPPPPSLSAEQKSAAESILSEYSASDLTEEDAQSIVEAFKEEGIQPSKDLKDT